MNHKSYHSQIVSKIRQRKRGNIIFPNDFLEIAPQTAIRKSLSRLVKDDFLIRLGNGIYLYPQIDEELGILYPSMEEVAMKIAKKEKVKLLPTGSYALNKLGLSTQIPTKVVYLTNGEGKHLKIGRNTITFRPTTPKKMSAKGKFSSLVIQALHELGKVNVDEVILKRIEDVLQQESPAVIRSDAKSTPAWIANILYNIANKLDHR